MCTVQAARLCGRYRLSRRKQILAEHFDAVPFEEDREPRYNIALLRKFHSFASVRTNWDRLHPGRETSPARQYD